MFHTIAVLSLLFSQAMSICYYPDGSVSAQDTPCDDASAEATCCGQGYACLSNHICKATGDEIQRPGASLYVRGSCTDKLWRSSSCPNFCVDAAPPNSDFVSGGMGMDKCPSGAGAITAAEDMYYCINSNTANVNCDKKQNIVSFRGTPRELTTIGVAHSSSSIPSTASSSSPSSTSTSPTTPILSPSALNPAVSSATTLATPQATPLPNLDSSSPGISTGAIIGASVGGVSAVVLLSALAGIMWCRKKRQTTRSHGNHPLPPSYQTFMSPESRGMSGYNHFETRKAPGAQELQGSHAGVSHAPQYGPFELSHN